MKTKTSKKYNYIYKITCLKPISSEKFYIGVRSSDIKPINDVKYMGSSKYLADTIKLIGVENFIKEIISIHPTREEAEYEEIRILKLFNVIKNNQYFNKHDNNNKGLNNINHVSVKDIRDNRLKIISTNDYIKYDYYKHVRNDLVSAINTETNKTYTVSRDEFLNDEKLVGVSSDMVMAKDKITNKTCRVSKEEFRKNKNLVGHSKGMVVAFDLITRERRHVTVSEFKINENLISIKSVIIKIFNDKDELVNISTKQFPNFCKEHKYPFKAFTQSYQNNGKPLYLNFSKSENKTRVVNNGNIKYKGWYALKESVV